jgi:hypothetical protein
MLFGNVSLFFLHISNMSLQMVPVMGGRDWMLFRYWSSSRDILFLALFSVLCLPNVDMEPANLVFVGFLVLVRLNLECLSRVARDPTNLVFVGFLVLV